MSLVRVFVAAGGDPAEESRREDAARLADLGVSRRPLRLVHPSLHPALDDYSFLGSLNLIYLDANFVLHFPALYDSTNGGDL